MSNDPHSRRRGLVRDHYGFDFPEDFFHFWEFAKRLRPLEPLRALEDTLGILMTGPFEVLAGRFDRFESRYSLLLHWRYYLDPPEFFTLLVGSSDGLHWGYYLDDPATGEGCVASYFAQDAFELSIDGDTLFEAIRLLVEEAQRDGEDDLREDPKHAAVYEARLAELDRVRQLVMQYATGKRRARGEEYAERWRGRSRRSRNVIAATPEGMGIVAPREKYRPLSLKDRPLWKHLHRSDDPYEIVEEAKQALREGYPATALKLGKDLWALHADGRSDLAWELLEEAYTALDREPLRLVLLAHRANRDRPWLDILQQEDAAE